MNIQPEVVHFSNTITCEECGVRKLCITNVLNAQQKQTFNSFTSKVKTLSKDETLFQGDEDLQSLFFLKSGSAKSLLISENGDEQIIAFHFPGEIIGLDNLTNSQYSSVTIFLEDSNVCRISKKSFDDLEIDIQQFQHEIISRINKENAHLQELLLFTNHLSAEQRIATFILEQSERMNIIGLSKTSFKLSMSRRDIGNYLGLASETVSRIFKSLERKAIIYIKNKNLKIVDFQGLKSKAHDCKNCSSIVLLKNIKKAS